VPPYPVPHGSFEIHLICACSPGHLAALIF
jgi:hypothetical protein